MYPNTPSVLANGVKAFEECEDKVIVDHVLERGGTGDWGACAARLDGRTSNQVRDRWHNAFTGMYPNTPSVPAKGAKAFEECEDKVIVDHVLECGSTGAWWAAQAPQSPVPPR